jgi:NAD(P)-dependent dehydrogenase (short-subunit alcohol dehydrogenase family)
MACATDISRRDQIDSMVAATLERFGRVDALINNAQTFRPTAAIVDITEEDLDVFYDSGVKGTLWAMQAVHPHMKAAGWGRIVNFASAAGITGMPGYGAYNASKEAIRALTRTTAREWGRDGIVVNAIAPGAASRRGLESAARDTEAHQEFMKDHPIGRQGDPETDIGPVALFLCSDACRYLTGQTFMVDGGAFLWA